MTDLVYPPIGQIGLTKTGSFTRRTFCDKAGRNRAGDDECVSTYHHQAARNGHVPRAHPSEPKPCVQDEGSEEEHQIDNLRFTSSTIKCVMPTTNANQLERRTTLPAIAGSSGSPRSRRHYLRRRTPCTRRTKSISWILTMTINHKIASWLMELFMDTKHI